jgi:tetratricopeptide (TPR) repeat protein
MASGNLELPKPIYLANISGEQYAKHNSKKRDNAHVPSDPSVARAQVSTQSTPAQIVPEITSNTSVESAEEPGVDQGTEVVFKGSSATQSEDTTGETPESNRPAASESTKNRDRAIGAEVTSEGSIETKTEAIYRQAVEKAYTLHKRSQHAKAKKEYLRALEINPNGAEALGKLAFYSLEESKYSDAIELAERATRIDPKSSEGWIVLGAARQATADREGAKLAYRKCSESTGQYVTECRRLLR